MSLRVLIISENISMRMGGESSLPFYYAKLFLERGVEVQLACHARVEEELQATFGDGSVPIHLMHDTKLQRTLHYVGERLGNRFKVAFTEQAIHLITQVRIRRLARELAASGDIDAVFEPAPISPKGVSLMYNIGVPIVIGPLCGGMSFPPAFRRFDSFATRILVWLGRLVANPIHRLLPGKLYADAILVANRKTQDALPKAVAGRVLQVFESGVDLDIWIPPSAKPEQAAGPVHFAFSGWFRDLKGVRFLVAAFVEVARTDVHCELHLVGGGELELELKEQVRKAGIEDKVHFYGWVERSKAAQILRDVDVFILPSLRECGGTVILEALALGKPVIATRWGGPADYVNDTCGILVEPDSEEGFIRGLAAAMTRLARSPALRASLGKGGIERVRQDCLSWDAKADRVLEVLEEVVERRADPRSA